MPVCVCVCVCICVRVPLCVSVCASVCVSADLSQPQRGRLDPVAGGGGELRVRPRRASQVLLSPREGAASATPGPHRGSSRRAPRTWAQGLPGPYRHWPRSAASVSLPGWFCPRSPRAALIPRPLRPLPRLRFSASGRPPLPGAALGAPAPVTAASAHPGLARSGSEFS